MSGEKNYDLIAIINYEMFCNGKNSKGIMPFGKKYFLFVSFKFPFKLKQNSTFDVNTANIVSSKHFHRDKPRGYWSVFLIQIKFDS